MDDARKILGAMIGVGLMTMGATALAQEEREFGDFDADNDARITLDEWHGGVGDIGIFGDRDLNEDDRIDENEFNALGMEDEDFDTWDANDDSYLDEDEYYEGTFEYFDEDESGHWDGDEWDDAGDEGFWDV